jgi:hypothetical protein
MIPPTFTTMSGRPTFAHSSRSRGTSTRCEFDIIEHAMQSASSSRALIARLRGVCQSPE